MGTFEITDNQASPNRTFASKYTDYNWTVPENDNLIATQAVTYSFTGNELTAVRSNAGFTLTEQIWWRERDLFDDNTIKRTRATYLFKADGTTVIYAPPNFNTTNGENTDFGSEGSTAEYYGWLNRPNNIHNYTTDELWLTNGGLGGGAVRNARTGTEGPGYALNLQFANPTLPTLAGATNYRLMTFDSADGTDFTVAAANASGYSLLSASSADLVYDSATDDVTFDPNTTFVPVYTDGEGAAGVDVGSGVAWSIQRVSDGKMFYLTGYTYSQVPLGVSDLPDGQSTTVSGGSIQVGSGALWLMFETDGESVGFLIVGEDGSGGSGGSGGSISGVAWGDTNADGIRDPGEPLLSGMQVNLLDEFDTVIDSRLTGPDGSYGFFLLGEGTYRIEFVPGSAGFTTQDKDQNQHDDVDSDVDQSTGWTIQLLLAANENLLNIDAGYLGTGSGGSGGSGA